MSITTYSELLGRLASLVTFDAENPGDASVSTLQAVLSMAEFRIYRELRTSHNMKAFSVSNTVTSNLMTLPSDFKAVSTINFGKKPLEPVSNEFMQEYLDGNPTGECRFFTNLANSLQFGPPIADGTQVQGYYSCTLPAITSDATLTSNTLFTSSNDLFLFACMVEAAPLYGFMDQIQLWETKYAMVRDALNEEQQLNAYAMGRMKIRPSTTLMG